MPNAIARDIDKVPKAVEVREAQDWYRLWFFTVFRFQIVSVDGLAPQPFTETFPGGTPACAQTIPLIKKDGYPTGSPQ